MSEDKYIPAARIIASAGMLPFPVNETLLDILKLIVEEDELPFIIAFKRKKSQTIQELLKTTRGKMTEDEILKHIESLAKKGLIFNQSSSSGVMVYRLLPLIMVGVFEYTFMKKLEFSEREKKIAHLFKKLFDEVRDVIQDKYDTFLPAFKGFPPVDRTMPILGKTVEGKEVQIIVDEEIEAPQEKILTTKHVEDLIKKFDDIAVGHCFCRHHQDLLDNPCKLDAPRENCLTFGKSARHIVNQGFGRMISREDATKILQESEEYGLVHKAYHTHSDLSKVETSVCNCCKCCCGTFDLYKSGVLPTVNASDYIARHNLDLCIGCGTCIEKCPLDAIELNNDNKAELNESYCIGCGVCAHFCPEGAISLVENQRTVFIPPPRLKN